jgi:hypothetical protein
MPAINLAQLKTLAARLAEKFNEPEAFLRELSKLLDTFTNHTLRTSLTISRMSLPTYRTPVPVLRQIQAEIVPLAEAHPTEGLALMNALWNAGSLESRLLAAYLLGSIPTAPAISALTQIPEWFIQSTDNAIRTALVTDAFARLRRENPDVLLLLLEDWLKSPVKSLQIMGLQALIPLLTDPNFENLPVVFRILKPAIRSAGPATQLELQACLATLGQVSPTETQAFLREIIHKEPPTLMLRTLRRTLPNLPPKLQSGLREVLREQGNQT